MDKIELQSWLVARLSNLRAVPPDAIDIRERFNRLGLDSMAATRLVSEIATKLGRSLSPTIAWEYPTIEALAHHLLEGAEKEHPAIEARAPAAVHDEPIAVIGMACRFPGAPNPEAFWRLLREGVDAVSEGPSGRPWDEALGERATTEERKTLRRAAFLEQIDGFDPLFFGISPREASRMDPQQRLVLELAWEALEDAGIRPATLKGSRTGVFAAAIWSDYAALLDRAGGPDQHTLTGWHHSIIANRVSYLFGLQGPSLTLDSACSSGLVTVHVACESLRRGESTLALASAVSLNLLPESALAVARLGALSPDGRCHTFDARANGFVRGEGGGVVVLKPLSRAIADGDPIHCVIRGSAVNNDGESNGLTAPNPKAQQALLREAYRIAGVDPRSVQYVEAHGTGTPLGDPIEAKALGVVLGHGREERARLLVGSAKTNVGHLEGAAGMVGLIKAAMCVRHRRIPPNLHFVEPNPLIPLAELGLDVPTSLRPFPMPDRRLLAGVSSFGFGGTNVHVVLEEWPAATPKLGELAEPMAARASPDGAPNVDGSRGVVFVFPGQGAQWHGMARALLQGEPVFRATIEQCDAFVRRYLGWSLIDELTVSPALSRLDRIDTSLPTIISIDIAIAALWRSWGIEPAAVVGHSGGEVAAAHVCGALDLEDAMRVICAYGRNLARRAGQGAMALVAVPWERASEVIAGFEGRVFPAIQDSAEGTVLAGEPAAIDAVVERAQKRGVFSRRVPIDVAPHCPLTDPQRGDFVAAIQGIRPRRSEIPLFSAVTGSEAPGESLDPVYWGRNFGEPLFFSRAVDASIQQGHRVFLDVGPHPLTRHSIETNLRHAQQRGLVLSSLRRDEDERFTLQDAAATLRALGLPLRRADRRGKAWLLPLAAKTHDALVASAAAMATYLRASKAELSDITYTAGARRDHFEHRLAVAGGSKEEMASALDAFARGESPPGLFTGQAPREAPRVVFVFPGQGSQWAGMGRALLEEEPAFRQALGECDAAIRREAGFSVLEELSVDDARSRLGETDVMQPVLFAVEVALAALWRSWGVEPAVVVGHSMGEVAAAFVVGALSLEDAAAVICRRSRLMRKVSGNGAMALVEFAMEDADATLEGYRDRLSVAAINGPRSTVIAGESSALEEVMASLEAKNVFCRRVKMDVASHSPQMAPLLDDLVAALQGITPRAASIPMRSTVTGQTLAGTELAAAYWADNLREPVRFSGVVQGLLREGNALFLELSPHPILLSSIEENLRESRARGAVAASLRRRQDERASLLASLGRLYVEGHPVDFRKLHLHGGRVVSLPSYPWQRDRYWVDAGTTSGKPQRLSSTSRRHGLLGEPFTVSALPTTLFYEGVLGTDRPPLADRRGQGRVPVPWGLYMQCIFEAARRKHESAIVIEDITFHEEPAIDEPNSLKVQLSLSGGAEGMTFALASIPIDVAGEERGAWCEHARGRLRQEDGETTATAERGSEDRTAIQARSDELSRESFYVQMAQRGLSYGAGLRVVQRAWVRSGEALGRLVLPKETQGAPGGDMLMPLLEGCFQLIHAALPARSSYCVRQIRRAHLGRVVASELFGLARVVQGTEDAMLATVLVTDDEGRTVVEIADMLLAPVAKQPNEDLDDAATAERLVRGIFREVTGRKDDDIIDTRELDEVGVDSLMTLQMLRRAGQAFGVEMSMRALARDGGARDRVTIRWFVDRVLSLRRAAGAAVEPVPESGSGTFLAERVERVTDSSTIHGGVLAAGIPIEASTITLSSGFSVEVMCVGRGAPLVLLCPILASIPIWVYQIQQFWRDYRIITLNWPGYGRSTRTATALAPSALARLVMAVLDAMGVREAAHVVGWSMGGLVAQELALSSAERVRSIGLINTTSCLDEEVDTLANFEDILGRLREDLQRRRPGLSPSLLQQRETALEACQREAGTNRSLGYMAEVFRFDARDRIRGIRAPTLVVQGREDKLAVRRYGRLMSREIPGATYHEFEEGGHFVPLHLPDAFNELLATFLSRNS